MHPVDQLSHQDLCKILQRLDRTGMRVPLQDSLKDIPRYRQTLRALPPDFTGRTRVLDLGTGSQWLPFYEIVLGYRHLTLNSKYPDSSELAGKLSVDGVNDARVNVSFFDVEQDPFLHHDAEFDVVCCFELLEHLAIDPMHMMFEINRVLKPDGLLVMTTPNVVRFANVVSILLGEHPCGWSPYNGWDTNRHNREYTPREVAALMSAGGFTVDSLETMGRKKRGFKRDILAKIVSWVLSPVRRCPRTMRQDIILCVARKTSQPKDRRPSWLYYEMSDRAESKSYATGKGILVTAARQQKVESIYSTPIRKPLRSTVLSHQAEIDALNTDVDLTSMSADEPGEAVVREDIM